MNVLTIVSAEVAQDSADDLVEAYEQLLAGPRPDGLLETRLCGDGRGHWEIHTLWRDHAALDAMRAAADAPAAPALFRRFGAEPRLSVLDVHSAG